MARLASGAGVAAAAYVALAWSRVHVPPYVDGWLLRHPQLAAPNLVWVPPPPPSERELGKTQPLTLSLVLGAVVLLSLLYVALDTWLARRATTRPLAWALRFSMVAFGLGTAWRASHFLGKVALGSLIPLALVLGWRERESAARSAPVSPNGGVVVLVAEAASLGWSFWLTAWDGDLGLVAIVPLFILVVAAALRTGQLGAMPDGQRVLERDGVIGAPLLGLPLLGLRREPSVWWIGLAVAACGVVALEARYAWKAHLDRLAMRNAHVFRALHAVVAPWALVAIVVIPMRFREIRDINHFEHEAQHLGWLNSISFGRLMMADAGFVYGPLREYLLGLIAWLNGGLTLEHVRESHIVLNLAGVALLILAGWWVCRRRPWLHLWWVWVVVTETQLALLVKYKEMISFGWNDLGRVAFACLVLVGASEAVTTSPGTAPSGGFFRVNRRLAWWGFACGVCTLYTQDFGPCAFGAVGVAIGADSLLRRGGGALVERVRRALQLAAAWTAGMIVPLVLFVLVYACFGRAGLLVRRVVSWTGLLFSASWGGLAFPLHASSFLQWETLAGHDDHAFAEFGYIVPTASLLLGGAVLVCAIVRRAWTVRTTLLLALFAFAFTSYRHGLIRSDIYHLHSDGAGALLLLFAMACDASAFRLRLGARARVVPIGAVVVALFAVGWSFTEKSWEPIRARLRQNAVGEETPSRGSPFDNTGIPRAGDIEVPANVKALVRYVNETTSPTDPIFVPTRFMTGGDLSFILDRRNPIPFDVPQELTTREDQAESLRDLQATPPVLIIGDYLPIYGQATRDFIDAHWKYVDVPGWGRVRRYQGPASAPPAKP